MPQAQCYRPVASYPINAAKTRHRWAKSFLDEDQRPKQNRFPIETWPRARIKYESAIWWISVVVSPEEVGLPPSLLAQDTLGTKKYFTGFHLRLKENAQVLI